MNITLWYFPFESFDQQDTLWEETSYLALLSLEEQERYHALKSQKRRKEFLCARVLLRQALAYHTGASPTLWQFSYQDNGRLIIDNPSHHQPINFALTHTRGAVVCAIVTADTNIGVDMEPLGRSVRYMKMSEAYFSSVEYQQLQAQPAMSEQLFFYLWTLKESYVKASGHDLLPVLRHAEFMLDDGRIKISGIVGKDDEDDSWDFCTLQIEQRYIVSLAVKKERAEEDNQLTLIRSVPLIEQQELPYQLLFRT